MKKTNTGQPISTAIEGLNANRTKNPSTMKIVFFILQMS